MCCTLDGTYIENSDPSILEKLKNCPDLTNAQAAAVEALLQSGKTQYVYVNSSNTSIITLLYVLVVSADFLKYPLSFLCFFPKSIKTENNSNKKNKCEFQFDSLF